jgi:kumamolisin
VSRYNFPSGGGEGQKIGLLEFGGGYFARDLRKFCEGIHVKVPSVRTISVDGIPTNRRDGDEGEVMLDIEVVAGLCPKASIIVYFCSWTEQGWISALDAVVHDKRNSPHVISVSWGNAEDAGIWTKQAIRQINESLKEAAYLGITVCVAAGDDGSSDAVSDGFAHVDFPSSSPYVLSVGGTTIPAGNANLADVVWKEGSGLRARNGGSTGGGISALLQRPFWQKRVRIKSVNPKKFVGRCVPDVAANADRSISPYGVVVDGKIVAGGGTSAASPLWAALVALINAKLRVRRPVGYLTPLLYRKKRGKAVGAVVCKDVLSGDNATSRVGGYSARVGYDAVSGWGTPNGRKLLSLFERMS